MTSTHRLASALALTLLTGIGFGQGAPALELRAEETVALFSDAPVWPENHFGAAFLEAVPPPRMRAILLDYHERCGAAVGLVPLARDARYSGSFLVLFEKGVEAELTIGVAPTPPHSIETWVIGVPRPSLASFEDLGKALEALPGQASLTVMKLGDEGQVVFQLEPDVPLAIGSAFKLFVLGALVADIADGEHGWSDVLPLDAALRSMPSGILQDWPPGSVHSLETLAGLMISQSDNTATDHLLHFLGRERVERCMGEMGNDHARQSTPLLATNEMFKLKWTSGGSSARAYLALETASERREYLQTRVVALSLDDFEPASLAKPLFIDSIEWFASTAGLCRAMDWLRRHTLTPPASRARALLAIQPGSTSPAGAFPFVGYKGGSEPGVLNLTWLLQARTGAWYAIAATWNDPAAALDTARFSVLAGRALFLLAARLEPPERR